MNIDLSREERIPSFKHQRKEWARRDEPFSALFWHMRTGKTKAIIDLACYHFLAGNITGLLVIAPNGVHANWCLRQLPEHGWRSVRIEYHIWRTSGRHTPEALASMSRVLAPEQKALSVLAMNSESIALQDNRAALHKFLNRHKGQILTVYDESHLFKHAMAQRTRTAVSISKQSRYKRILTGTPNSESPLALFSQFNLLKPGLLGFKTLGGFKARYAIYKSKRLKNGREYATLKAYKNLDDLRKRYKPYASIVRRDEVEDMPKVLVDEQLVELLPAQATALKDMRKYLVTALANGELLTAEEGGAALIKIDRIVAGHYGLSSYKTNLRIERLLSILDLDEQTIVWCRYKEDIRLVTARLRAEKISFVEYHGNVSHKKREEAINTFQRGEARIFVGQPKAGGAGLDLSAASTIIWYTYDGSGETWQQATERATKVSGKHINMVILRTPKTTNDRALQLKEEKARRAEYMQSAKIDIRQLLNYVQEDL